MEDKPLNISLSTSTRNGKVYEDTVEEIKQGEGSAEKTATFREKWKDPEFMEKFRYSMFMAGVFVALGMYVGQHGPTFLDMQIITNSDIEASAAFFTSGNAGYLTGSVVTGIIYNKMNKPLLMFITTLGLGLVNIVIPYFSDYTSMIFIRYCCGLFAGGIDTTINSEHMRIWGAEANGLLQFLHLCFSIGGFLAPLMAEPFLARKIETLGLNGNRSINATVGNGSFDSNSTSLNDFAMTDTRVHYLFLIVGLFSVLVSIPFLVTFIMERGKSESQQSDEKRQFTRKGVPFPLLLVMLCGILFFYFIYCCVEDSFFSFLMTFLVEEYDISKTKGALTTAVAWAAFALGRFMMIFMSKLLNPVKLLLLMTTTMAIAFSSFTVFAHIRIVDALIVFSAFSALSCSGVFPSGFSWMEAEMFQVTGVISSCVLVASTLGSIVNPLIIGYLMEGVGNLWFCYLLTIDTFILGSILVALLVLSRYYIDRKYGTLAESLEISDTVDPPEGGDGGGDNNDDGVKVSFIQ